jgi:general secretion pathway protein M
MSKATQELRARADAFWQVRTEQERKLLRIGGIGGRPGPVLWRAGRPALDGRAELHKSLPQLRQQAAEMQAMAREAQALQARTPSRRHR